MHTTNIKHGVLEQGAGGGNMLLTSACLTSGAVPNRAENNKKFSTPQDLALMY